MKKALLNQALNIAIDKIYLHPEFEYYIHYTFIVQDNKIIEWGTNNKTVPAVHFGYQARLENEKFLPKMHSELSAYRKAKGLLKKKDFEIINIRLSKSKEIRMSKPCSCCYSIMKELGCSKFWFTGKNGFLRIF